MRSSTDKALALRPLSASQIDNLCDMTMHTSGADSLEDNLKKGRVLKWVSDTFKTGKGKVKKIFAIWADAKTGEPITRWKTKSGWPPTMKLVLPPGPVKASYLTVKEVFHFDPKPESAAQVIEWYENADDMSPEDGAKFKRFFDAIAYLNKFLNDERCKFLAYNVKDHDALVDEQRELGLKDPEKLYEELKRENMTKGNNRQHQTHANKPKRKIFKEGQRNSKGEFNTGISAATQVQLDQLVDEDNHVRSFIESENGAKDLNMYAIMLPDGTNLQLDELGLIQPTGAVAAPKVAIYGVNVRMDGGEPSQHSVMYAATGAQFFSNGESSQKADQAMDVMAFLDQSEGTNDAVSDEALLQVAEPDAEPEQELKPIKSETKRKSKESGSSSKKSRISFD